MKRNVIFACLALSGCSNIPVYENAYHVMNVIDMGQTVHITRAQDCFREVGTLSYITGQNPSHLEAVAYSAAFSVAYHYTNRWLESKIASKEPGTQAQGNWVIAHAVFNGVTLVTKFGTIMNNADIGLEPWGRGC